LNKFHIYAPINVGIWRQCVCFWTQILL